MSGTGSVFQLRNLSSGGLGFALWRLCVSTKVMKGGETAAHAELKRLALAWAQTNGFAMATPEVRVPRCGFRADVAAYAPVRRDAAAGHGWTAPRTAVFECKQARADLLKDAHAEAKTRGRLGELVARRAKLEELLATHRPDLRRGETLFPEFDSWDFSGLEHQAYRAVLKELTAVQEHVLRGTKFARMFRYQSADFLYLVVEDGIFAEAEIPAGWGLLRRKGDGLEMARPPAALEATPEQRLALLESIGIAAMRAVNREARITLVELQGLWGWKLAAKAAG